VSPSSYVYQLVDDAGDAVYYGISNAPARRLAQHALEAKVPFRGMQVISEAEPLAQARALETSLIQQAISEGRTIYNIAPHSISPVTPVQVPRIVMPQQTFLNPTLYPH
jgi:predicted GIY-YIG superfamily endonuclease